MKDRGRGVSAQLNSSANSAVTQPVGQARSARRTQQIKALHSEFEDLKKKIKDVENKNQKIIQNIHKQYDFKKKPQHIEYIGDTSPIVYIQQSEIRPVEKSAHKSERLQDNSENQDRDSRIQNRRNSHAKKNVTSPFPKVLQNLRKDQREQSDMVSSKISNHLNRPAQTINSNTQIGLNSSSQLSMAGVEQPQEAFQVSQFNGLHPYQMSMQFPSYTAPFPNVPIGQVPFYNQSYPLPQGSYSFQDQMRRDRQKIKLLQKQLQTKQQQTTAYRRLQKKYGLLSITFSEQVEGMLQIFMQQVIKKKLYEIDKHVKKNENKLKRLQLQIRDRQEEEISNRNIKQNRLMRQQSNSKRNSPPKETSNNSVGSISRKPKAKLPVPQSSPPPKNKNRNQSQSKLSDLSKSNQQFSIIASGYEQMIKVKNRDIEVMQKKLKQKDKELMEITIRYGKLQKKLADLEQIPKDNKHRKFSEKEDNLLENLHFNQEYQQQIKLLKSKVTQLEENLKSKIATLRQRQTASNQLLKKVADYQNKSKKLQAEIVKLKEESRRVSTPNKPQIELQTRIKKLQNELQIKQKQSNLIRQKCSKMQSQKIERQCDNLTLTNKLSKVQNLLSVKESKIQELQKIIQTSSGNDIGDLLEKSVYLQKVDSSQIRKMQEDKQKLQEQLTSQRQQIFLLKRNNQSYQAKYNQLINIIQNMKKQHDNLMGQNQTIRNDLKSKKFQQPSIRVHPPKIFSDSDRTSEAQDEIAIREQLEQLRAKYEQTQRTLKYQKHQSLDNTTKVIKLTSEVNYYREELSERQDRYQKLRKELQQSRLEISRLKKELEQKDEKLEAEQHINKQRIKDIEQQFFQFQEQKRRTSEENKLEEAINSEMKNSRFSQQSYANYKTTFSSISLENQQLKQKIKEKEKIIEVQTEMENKIVNQYRENIERIKVELRQKTKQNQILNQEIEILKNKIKNMEQTQSKLRERPDVGSQLQRQAEELSQRIIELEKELMQAREINTRCRSVQQELFKQISGHEEERESLIKLIHSKQGKIQQLYEIIELKQLNFNSNISSSMHKSKMRESVNSQSSLRYSTVTNTLVKDKTVDMELSEVGESFFQGNQSVISNVSQVFAREQFPYQKMQLKRVQQRRLFEKTAAYIKSLKNAIDDKDKKIKLLQKKIDSLRNSQLVRKDIYEIKYELENDKEEVFDECLSVQLQRTNWQRYRYRQLQHETKLTIEENNLLNNQIESLEDELLKAEEQQASLMKLKDLYKEQIKSLIKQNQQQAKTFEDQMKKQKQKSDDSQSVQRMQAIKQLYLKIIKLLIAIQNDVPKTKKREDRHRQLQDYIKVCSGLLNLQATVRDKFLTDLKK